MEDSNKWLEDYTYLHYDILDSTNNEAVRVLDSGIEGDLVVVADSQFKARGRNGRTFYAPNGSIYMTIVIHPDLPYDKLGELPFVVAVALGEVLSQYIDSKEIFYKWPNDVIVGGKKLAGILIETCSFPTSQMPSYVLIGIGVNIKEIPKEVAEIATSLSYITGKPHSVNELIARIMDKFQDYYQIWFEQGFAPIRGLWMQHAYRLNEMTQVRQGDKHFSGHFIGIDEEGCLMLQDGEKQHMLSTCEIIDELSKDS